MAWELLSVIGIIAFAVSGAIVAMEEEYDILGVYILGIVTAFGGGAIRNLLIGVPVSALWEQGAFFQIALASVTIVFLFPKLLLRHWSKWGNLSDAIGLSAFAIQGALYAVKMEPSAQCGDCGSGPYRQRGRHHTGSARGQEAACAQGGNICGLGRARRVNRESRLGRGCRRFVCAVSCACGMPHLQLCVQVAPAESFLSYRSVKNRFHKRNRFFFITASDKKRRPI